MSYQIREMLKPGTKYTNTFQKGVEMIMNEDFKRVVDDSSNKLNTSVSNGEIGTVCYITVSNPNPIKCEVRDNQDEIGAVCSMAVTNPNPIKCEIRDNQDYRNEGNVGDKIVKESSSSHAAGNDLKRLYLSCFVNAETDTYSSYASDSMSTSTEEEMPQKSKSNSDKNKKRKNSSKLKGKCRFPNPDNWKKNQAKRLRNSGQSYVSCSSGKKVYDAKKVLPPCTEKCKLKCYEKFTEDERQRIFQEYWGLASLQKQRDFLLNSMTDINPKYRYAKENSNRRLNNAYFFQLHGQRIRVCKCFFKSTLCINDRPIRTVLQKKEIFSGEMISLDLRGKHGKQPAIDEKIKDGVRKHIQSIPRIPGHYCHSTSSKECVLSGKSVADLYRNYENSCKVNKIVGVNYTMFARIFKDEFNLSFFDPKKAHCGLCIAYVRGNESNESQVG